MWNINRREGERHQLLVMQALMFWFMVWSFNFEYKIVSFLPYLLCSCCSVQCAVLLTVNVSAVSDTLLQCFESLFFFIIPGRKCKILLAVWVYSWWLYKEGCWVSWLLVAFVAQMWMCVRILLIATVGRRCLLQNAFTEAWSSGWQAAVIVCVLFWRFQLWYVCSLTSGKSRSRY